MKALNSSVLAWGSVVIAGTLWGGGAIVGDMLVSRGMSPQSLALARFALGLPLLWAWHLIRPASSGGLAWNQLTTRDRLLVVSAGVGMALSVSSWFAGIKNLGPGLSTVIAICCAPVIVAAVSVARGYERLTVASTTGLGGAVTGAALVASPQTGWSISYGHAVGLGWSFAAAAFQAWVVIANARMPREISATASATWASTAAALCMAAIVVVDGFTLPTGFVGWAGVTYTGVVTTSVAYFLFAWGARRLTPIAAIVGIMVEPLVATLLAAFLFAQTMTLRQSIGAALLLASMWPLTSRNDPQNRRVSQGPRVT